MELNILNQAFSCLFSLLILVQLIVKTNMSVHGNNEAFIQSNNEVQYLVNGIPVSVHKEFSSQPQDRGEDIEENSIQHVNMPLKFDPPLLDFKQRHLGIPHHEKVTLFNINNNKTIHMSSISGDTVHFHSSFFENKIIPPLGNTTFNVVFLGREEGAIESNLFIHTSEGSFKYQVKGSSIGSPYRLKPLVGVKLPINATYSRLIYMHNPHNSPLQIVEIYSSGGEFHLELPSGELEGPKHLWEIPPYHTKPVIRVHFHARAEKNHTAYIRIKVNQTGEVLVVPVEVEVSASPGLYASVDTLDFGLGGSHDKPKQLKLLLYNSWQKAIRIQNIISTPVSKALKITFQPVKVPPESKVATQVALITFDWKAAYETRHMSGKLVLKSKQTGHKLIIPYTARVVEGGLIYNASVTQYCADVKRPLGLRNFSLTNTYGFSVVITNVSLQRDAKPHFNLLKFSPVTLKPGESVVLFQLVARKESQLTELRLESHIYLYTNVSRLAIPLLCYNGRLAKVIWSHLNETILDLGTVTTGKQKEAFFAVLNYNPVTVELRSWGTNLTGGTVEFVGIEEGNVTTVLQRLDFRNMTSSLRLKAGYYAIFRVFAVASKNERISHAEVFVNTQFERVTVAARMRVAHGSLDIDQGLVNIKDCFPGKLCVTPIQVNSRFQFPMDVISLQAIPTDTRVTFVQARHQMSIAPLSKTIIGDLIYDPDVDCVDHCYLGLCPNSTSGKQWVQSLRHPTLTQDGDVGLLNIKYEHYLANVGDMPIGLQLDSSQVRGYTFKARVILAWPRLSVLKDESSDGLLPFPLTQIGNTSYTFLKLHNPTVMPVIAQLVLEWFYMKGGTITLPKRLLSSLLSFLPNCADCPGSDPGEFTLHEDSKKRAELEEKLGVRVLNSDCLTIEIPPGKTVMAKLGFTPSKTGETTAMLFIRNNLTVLEVVGLKGTGAHAQFKFGNRKPGSGTPLMFELAEKHLKDCEREKHRKFPAPNLTVKRSFTARNVGDLPIEIHNFRINGHPCEGYGFRILNCGAFQLPPNGTRKIDIAFTPDFTLSRIQRVLSIDTSLGIPVNYTLITTLPPYFLETCSTILGRPSWEPLLYYSAISFMIFLLFCVLAAAFLESDRILKCAFSAMAKEKANRLLLDNKFNLNIPPKPSSPPPPPPPPPPPSILNSVRNDRSVFRTTPPVIAVVEYTQISSNWLDEKLDNEKDKDLAKNEELEINYTSPPKTKKKISKKNSNASDNAPGDTIQDVTTSKKAVWGNNLLGRNNNKSNKISGTCVETIPTNKMLNNNESTALIPSSISISTHNSKRTLDMNKDINKNRNSRTYKKSSKINTELIPCSEEETSSTTTDSSSNNDDSEKDKSSMSNISHNSSSKRTTNSSKVTKASQTIKEYIQKNQSLNESTNSNGNNIGKDSDFEFEDYCEPLRESTSSSKRNSKNKGSLTPNTAVISPTTSSTSSSNNKESTSKALEGIILRPYSLELPYKLKPSKSNRDRKERKEAYKQRQQAKVSSNSDSASNSTSNSNNSNSIRVSPPPLCRVLPMSSSVSTSLSSISSGCWGENKATFSDVVAYSNQAPPAQRKSLSQSQSLITHHSHFPPKEITHHHSRMEAELAGSTQLESPSLTSPIATNHKSLEKCQDPSSAKKVQQGPLGPIPIRSSPAQANQSPQQQQTQQMTPTSPNSNLQPLLGPIGTKKSAQSVWGNYFDPLNKIPSFTPNSSNSLFTDSFSEPVNKQLVAETSQGSDCTSVTSPFPESLWEQNSLMLRLKKEEHRQNLFKENWPASLWDPLCTPAGSTTSVSSTQQENAVNNPSSSGLNSICWPSSSPWPDPVGASAPFGMQQNHDMELDRSPTFDPFRSLNNIWSPKGSNQLWSPPKNE